MSAVFRESLPGRRSMTLADIDRVLAVETRAYPFPWSRGNFIDSLAAAHVAEVWVDGTQLVGYFVAMAGFDELHLLNLTVAPEFQRRGYARGLLDAVVQQTQERALAAVWLEVRLSNERAQALYLANGFVRSGTRRGYYPAAAGQREDAVVMSRQLPAGGARVV